MQHDREPLSLDANLDLPLTLSLSDCDLGQMVGIAERFGSQHYGYSVTPNVDHLIRYCEDPAFRELYRSAQYVLLDSRFLARVLRLATGARLPTCPGSDLTAALFNGVIRRDDRLVMIGGDADQATHLREAHGLQDLRHHNPPMGFVDDARAVETTLQFIEAQSPFRFCFLAVGSPQQEILARALKVRGKARGLALCVGASINFLTGGERRAPRWMQKLGMEWAYRLLNNPSRMAGRYLVRGPRIFFLIPRLKFLLRRPADLVQP